MGHLRLCAAALVEGRPIHGADPAYPLYAITFKSAETNFAENLSIPVVNDLTQGVLALRGVLLNPVTAARYGVEDGDSVEIESRFGRVEGVAALSRGPPGQVAVANALTRKTPRERGTPFNVLLPAELEFTDRFTGALESCARVRVKRIEAPV